MGKISTARVNLFLYSLLLIITPFLLLQNYLQDAIGILSDMSFFIGSVKIPFILAAFVLFVGLLVIRFRKSLGIRCGIVWLVIFLMWMIGQRTADYYLDLPFYQLQHNWHYFAYGIYAFLAYQVFSAKTDSPGRIVMSIFLMAMMISVFDEALQVLISTRVFDISDIAKDLWGTLMGSIFVFFVYKKGEIVRKGWRIREKKRNDYLKNPLSLLVFMMIFTYILLFVSSNLSDSKYGFSAVLITIAVFLVLFYLVHITRTKRGRIVAGVISGILLVFLLYSIITNSDRDITRNKPGLTVYKGIPVPYFDIMIFENGGFRLVDKKTFFNQTDIKFFFRKASNILLIGSGEDEKPRMGFPEHLESQFVYNNVTGRALQVIILPTEKACEVFNRLKKENRKVVFVIHNTK